MVKVPDRFLTNSKQSPPMEGRGTAYGVEFVSQADTYFQNQRRTLPSVWNEANRSTNYAIQLRARARELARHFLSGDQITKDFYVQEVRPEFLYRNFGYLLKLKDPFFFPEKSDAFYRRFVQSLMQVLFKGSTKAAIQEGLSIFLEGIPFNVEQLYLDNIRPGYYTPSKKLKNKFAVNLDLDNIALGSDLNFATKGLEFFLEIAKPAHNAYIIQWKLSDRWDTNAVCTPVFDLLMGDKLATLLKKDSGSSLTISNKVENKVYLSDMSVLFLRDTTELLDENDDPLVYGDFNIGDPVSFEYNLSTGRIQYHTPFILLPPDLLTSSLGYIHEPFLDELSEAFRRRSDFLLFAKKVKSHGFDAQVKQPTAVCERIKSNLFSWHYDDFRHCGLPTEVSKLDTDAYSTYDALNKTVKTKYSPVVVGDGSFDLATVDDVIVNVNSVQVNVIDINPLTGLISLENAVPANADVEIIYTISKYVAYALQESTDGSYLNHFYNKNLNGYNNYGSVLNQDYIDEGKKTLWKTSAFDARYSSLENYAPSLLLNDKSQYHGKFNQSKVTRNYEYKECRISQINTPLGLNLDGVVLNYPTPPVPLRFDIKAPATSNYILLPNSSILNDLDKILNGNMILNDVLLELISTSFSNRYSFYEVEQTDVGGFIVPDPFCETTFRAVLSGLDYSDVYDAPEEIDTIYMNTLGLENESNFYTGANSFLKTTVISNLEDTPDPVEDEGIQSLSINANFNDIYKNVPLNIIIENDAESDWVGGNPTNPVFGQDPDSEVLSNPNELLNDSFILNNADTIQIGVEDAGRDILIPPSRVFPIDGLDVVPPELKSDPSDTNYIFYEKRTFEEELSLNISTGIFDEYLYVHERVLNAPQAGLNDPPTILNPSFDNLFRVSTKLSDVISGKSQPNVHFGLGGDGPVLVTVTDYFYQFTLNDSRLTLNDEDYILNDTESHRIISTLNLTLAAV